MLIHEYGKYLFYFYIVIDCYIYFDKNIYKYTDVLFVYVFTRIDVHIHIHSYTLGRPPSPSMHLHVFATVTGSKIQHKYI